MVFIQYCDPVSSRQLIDLNGHFMKPEAMLGPDIDCYRSDSSKQDPKPRTNGVEIISVKNPKTSQELRRLSSVTLNCQVTKIVKKSSSQLSAMLSVSQMLQVTRISL